jgi:predicted RNase H-like HicB family nuclease
MSYTAIVTREGQDWLADVPELDGASTFAATLRSLIENVREVVILAADLADDAEVDIDLCFDVDDQAVQDAAAVRDRRQQLSAELASVRADTVRAVENLCREGYSSRDAAEIVGITHGRVAQMRKAS